MNKSTLNTDKGISPQIASTHVTFDLKIVFSFNTQSFILRNKISLILSLHSIRDLLPIPLPTIFITFTPSPCFHSGGKEGV